MVDVPEDETTGHEPGRDWVLDEVRIQELLSTSDTGILFISACAPNQETFYLRFDHIILLTAPASVIVERLASRTTNPYGKRAEELARVLMLQTTIEPMLRRGAGAVIDTSALLDDVEARVLQITGESRLSTSP